MCFYYSINKNKSSKLKSTEIVTDRQLSLIEDFRVVNAFKHPVMPVIKSKNSLSFAKWGLIPNWVKTEENAFEMAKYTLNAKSESIFEKPSFRGSVITKRCLIPCSGFYEWKHENKKKTPYFISLKDDEMFCIAGIWDNWLNPNTAEISESFSIITCAANEMMEEIHNTKKRMPVIIYYKDIFKWLNSSIGKDEITELMMPLSSDLMKASVLDFNPASL